MKINVHTCYLGETGYNNHARGLVRALRINNNILDIRVRSCTEGIGRDDIVKLVHDPADLRRDGLFENPDVDLVLVDTYHPYFFEKYSAKVTIACTVWESTTLPIDFVNQLKKFNYLFVVSEWHKNMIVAQGYPSHRVFVVPQGYNEDILNVSVEKTQDCIFVGRWDYRKSIPEIVKAYLESGVPGKLHLIAENPFSNDGFTSTEERLKSYCGLTDSEISEKFVIHKFLERSEYLKTLKSSQLFISCAKAEGWNIPLMEAVVMGVKSVYSKYGAQLQFMTGMPYAVPVLGTEIVDEAPNWYNFGESAEYGAPEYQKLSEIIKQAYWGQSKDKTNELKETLNWVNISKNLVSLILNLTGKVACAQEDIYILSHANTKLKEDLLKQCCNFYKRRGDVTVISHILLPTQIGVVNRELENANHVLNEEDLKTYQKSPVTYFWNSEVLLNGESLGDGSFNVEIKEDYGCAVLNLIVEALEIAKSKGNNQCIISNYDYIPYHNVDFIKATSEDHIAAMFSWEKESYNTGIFKVFNVSRLLDILEPFKNKMEYLNKCRAIANDKNLSCVYFEQFVYWILKEHHQTVLLCTKKEHVNTVWDAVHVGSMKWAPSVYDGFAFAGTMLLEGKRVFVAWATHNINVKTVLEDKKSLNLKEVSVRRSFKIPEKRIVCIPLFEDEYCYTVWGEKFPEIKDAYFKHTVFPELKPDENIKEEDTSFVTCDFNSPDGVRVELRRGEDVNVEFADQDSDLKFVIPLSPGCWAAAGIVYFRNWKVTISSKERGDILKEFSVESLEGKTVQVIMGTPALGDYLAAIPYIIEFKKKHKCKVIVNIPDHYREIIDDSEFERGGKSYLTLWLTFVIKEGTWDPKFHRRDPKSIPLQSVFKDQLGLGLEIPLNLKCPLKEIKENALVQRLLPKKYTVYAIHSTAQAKYVDPLIWDKLAKEDLKKGLTPICISREGSENMGNYISSNICTLSDLGLSAQQSLSTIALIMKGAEKFYGIGTGLSWLAFSLNLNINLYSQFSEPYTEFIDKKTTRFYNSNLKVCQGCFNRYTFDPSNWFWCPKGRDFECAYAATDAVPVDSKFIEKFQKACDLGMIQNYSEIFNAIEYILKTYIQEGKQLKNYMEIGTDQGGVALLMTDIAERVISVDLENGPFGVSYDLTKVKKILESKGVECIRQSSHLKTTKILVEDLLKGEKLQLLFIDGDHSYSGVRKDFEMYKSLVESGGFVMFHDSKSSEYHRTVDCGVPKYINQLSADNEIKRFETNNTNFGGIALLRIIY